MARGGAVLAPVQVHVRRVVGMEAGGFGLGVTGIWQRVTGCGSGRHVAKWRRIAGFLWQNGNGSPDSRNAAAIHMSQVLVRFVHPDRFDTRTGPRPVPGPAPGPVPGAKGQPAPRGAKPRGQSPRGCALEKVRSPVVYFFHGAPLPTRSSLDSAQQLTRRTAYF